MNYEAFVSCLVYSEDREILMLTKFISVEDMSPMTTGTMDINLLTSVDDLASDDMCSKRFDENKDDSSKIRLSKQPWDKSLSMVARSGSMTRPSP